MPSSVSSSPSPPASSSLKAPTLADAPEVHHEEMEVDVKPSTSSGIPSAASSSGSASGSGMDMNSVNNMIQALLVSGTLGETPNLNLSSLFGTPDVKNVKREFSPHEGETPKKARLKVFSNGYFMTFDKVSSCQKKHFWRCEYKNTCKARMHTDILSEKILTFIHEHNHSAPTDDEIRLYGLDPATIETNRVYIVGNTADPNQRRKIRKQVADAEAAQKRIEAQQEEERNHQHTVAAIAAARAACAQASSMAGTSSAAAAASLLQSVSCPTTSVGSMTPTAMLLAQLPFMKQEIPAAVAPYMSPNLPLNTATPIAPPMSLLSVAPLPAPPAAVVVKTEPCEASGSRQGVKRKASDVDLFNDPVTQDPMFAPTFEIAQKLKKLWKPEPNRYPRTVAVPTRHFDFYIAKDDGKDEHLFVAMRLEERKEQHLKEILEEFVNERCPELFLFGVSPKISIMFNEPMLNTWDNNQFFLIDTSNPTRWRLSYVDEKAT